MITKINTIFTSVDGVEFKKKESCLMHEFRYFMENAKVKLDRDFNKTDNDYDTIYILVGDNDMYYFDSVLGGFTKIDEEIELNNKKFDFLESKMDEILDEACKLDKATARLKEEM